MSNIIGPVLTHLLRAESFPLAFKGCRSCLLKTASPVAFEFSRPFRYLLYINCRIAAPLTHERLTRREAPHSASDGDALPPLAWPGLARLQISYCPI